MQNVEDPDVDISRLTSRLAAFRKNSPEDFEALMRSNVQLAAAGVDPLTAWRLTLESFEQS